MLDGEQAQIGIPGKGRMMVHLERNQRIVLCLHQQSGHANPIEELIRRLRGVIIVRGTESKGRRGEPVVKIVDVLTTWQIGQLEKARRQLLFERTRSFKRLTNRRE